MTADSLGLQADFMPVIHGVRSSESLRNRAVAIAIDGWQALVAALDDIIASKRAAGRDRVLAVLPVLERTAALSGKRVQTTAPARRTAKPSGGGHGRATKQDR